MADKILSSYESAIAVAVDFALPKGFAFSISSPPKFQVYKTRSLRGNTELRTHDSEITEYRCTFNAGITVTAGAEKQAITLAIESKEVPRPLTYANERLGEVIKDKEISTDSLSERLPTESLYPMFVLLRRILERATARSYPDMQALGLDTATMAFQEADKTSTCTLLKELTIRGYHRDSGSDINNIKRTLTDLRLWSLNSPQKGFMIRLQRSDYEKSKRAINKKQPATQMRRAYIAIGSNVGDRLSMVESACLEMGRRGIAVIRTSGLYETEPMYLQDQNSFINGACEVCTPFRGAALTLHTLQG